MYSMYGRGENASIDVSLGPRSNKARASLSCGESVGNCAVDAAAALLLLPMDGAQ